jgi:hypothetical protein
VPARRLRAVSGLRAPPLAEATDPLRAGFEGVGRWFADDWADLRAGVSAATADLGETDERVASMLPEVA